GDHGEATSTRGLEKSNGTGACEPPPAFLAWGRVSPTLTRPRRRRRSSWTRSRRGRHAFPSLHRPRPGPGRRARHQRRSVRLLVRVRRRDSAASFRHRRQAPRAPGSLHPDLGFWVAHMLSRRLADNTRDRAVLDRAERAQAEYAAQLLGRRPDLDLAILAHTHRPALLQLPNGRAYVNPGAFLDGGRYAVVTTSGVELK